MSTLTAPMEVPSIADDCEQLHKAFSGWGTNEDLIIEILGHRNAAQRKAIRQFYAETYGEDLLKALDKELTRDFERLVLLWTLEPADRDAVLANEATKKWTRKSNQIIVEIACSRSPRDLLLVREAYHARFKRSLEEDVAHHSNGEFRKLLVPLVSSYRYGGEDVDLSLAKSEAKLLHEKDCASDDFIRIVTTRSKPQLNATLNQYNDLFQNDIIKELEGKEEEFVATVREAMECLVRPVEYFEKAVREAVARRGTDEGALTRVVATRVEVDMQLIKDEYLKRNSVPLHQAIAKDTHGDYEKMLLTLIGQ